MSSDHSHSGCPEPTVDNRVDPKTVPRIPESINAASISSDPLTLITWGEYFLLEQTRERTSKIIYPPHVVAKIQKCLETLDKMDCAGNEKAKRELKKFANALRRELSEATNKSTTFNSLNQIRDAFKLNLAFKSKLERDGKEYPNGLEYLYNHAFELVRINPSLSKASFEQYMTLRFWVHGSCVSNLIRPALPRATAVPQTASRESIPPASTSRVAQRTQNFNVSGGKGVYGDHGTLNVNYNGPENAVTKDDMETAMKKIIRLAIDGSLAGTQERDLQTQSSMSNQSEEENIDPLPIAGGTADGGLDDTGDILEMAAKILQSPNNMNLNASPNSLSDSLSPPEAMTQASKGVFDSSKKQHIGKTSLSSNRPNSLSSTSISPGDLVSPGSIRQVESQFKKWGTPTSDLESPNTDFNLGMNLNETPIHEQEKKLANEWISKTLELYPFRLEKEDEGLFKASLYALFVHNRSHAQSATDDSTQPPTNEDMQPSTLTKKMNFVNAWNSSPPVFKEQKGGSPSTTTNPLVASNQGRDKGHSGRGRWNGQGRGRGHFDYRVGGDGGPGHDRGRGRGRGQNRVTGGSSAVSNGKGTGVGENQPKSTGFGVRRGNRVKVKNTKYEGDFV